MKWLEYLSNILFWAISGLVIVSSFSIQSQEIEILDQEETIRTIRDPNIIRQLLVAIVISAIAFYGNLYNISYLNTSFSKRRILLLSMGIFGGSIIGYLLVEYIFFTHLLVLPKLISIGIILLYLTVSTVYGLVKVWIQGEQQQRRLALAAKQAELNLLRNQLHPHFLFNALNNLLSLVNRQQSPKLASSFEELSQLLRYVIEETKAEQVPIQNEINFIKNYCHLQQLRFEEDEIQLNIGIQGAHGHQLVEPGLFIPFVENAFKYGATPEEVSTIDIQFELNSSKEVQFFIRNEIKSPPLQPQSTGTGITSIRERLNLVYPNRYVLEINENGYYEVKLKIATS